jgi:hypothetical protein
MQGSARRVWLASIVFVALPCASLAQSADDLAKQSQNPCPAWSGSPSRRIGTSGSAIARQPTTLNIQPVAVR